MHDNKKIRSDFSNLLVEFSSFGPVGLHLICISSVLNIKAILQQPLTDNTSILPTAGHGESILTGPCIINHENKMQHSPSRSESKFTIQIHFYHEILQLFVVGSTF